MAKIAAFTKPTLSTKAIQDFAEGATSARVDPAIGKGASSAKNAPAGLKSGLVPDGDVRLTANIRADLHLKLKIRAAQERTTVGELVEQWIESWD
jgi:hypothetical protein